MIDRRSAEILARADRLEARVREDLMVSLARAVDLEAMYGAYRFRVVKLSARSRVLRPYRNPKP